MNDKIIGNERNILFYNDEEGNVQIEVLFEWGCLVKDGSTSKTF